MSDYIEKSNAIINGSIIIALYFIFLIIVSFLMPIISLGLRLFPKESQFTNDSTQDTLKDSWASIDYLIKLTSELEEMGY